MEAIAASEYLIDLIRFCCSRQLHILFTEMGCAQNFRVNWFTNLLAITGNPTLCVLIFRCDKQHRINPQTGHISNNNFTYGHTEEDFLFLMMLYHKKLLILLHKQMHQYLDFCICSRDIIKIKNKQPWVSLRVCLVQLKCETSTNKWFYLMVKDSPTLMLISSVVAEFDTLDPWSTITRLVFWFM